MITGDMWSPAAAIARELGILVEGKRGDDRRGTGQSCPMKNWPARVRNISVYARVSPEDKIRIVRAWQSQARSFP